MHVLASTHGFRHKHSHDAHSKNHLLQAGCGFGEEIEEQLVLVLTHVHHEGTATAHLYMQSHEMVIVHTNMIHHEGTATAHLYMQSHEMVIVHTNTIHYEGTATAHLYMQSHEMVIVHTNTIHYEGTATAHLYMQSHEIWLLFIQTRFTMKAQPLRICTCNHMRYGHCSYKHDSP